MAQLIWRVVGQPSSHDGETGESISVLCLSLSSDHSEGYLEWAPVHDLRHLQCRLLLGKEVHSQTLSHVCHV